MLRVTLASMMLLTVLVGCRTGTGVNTRLLPVAALASANSVYGTAATSGTLAGRVGRFDGVAFVPAAGVTVTLDQGATATTDAAGFYGFSHVPGGLHAVAVTSDGHFPASVAFRLHAVSGLGRVNVALVPTARPVGLAADVIALAGVAVDPRGVALPGATIRCADSLTAQGNHTAMADADGFWVLPLTGVTGGLFAGGQASLTVFGETPGGVKVESAAVVTVPLGQAPTVPLVAATSEFTVPSDLHWVTREGTRRVLAAKGLPTRRDELVVRVTRAIGYTEASPVSLADGNVVVEVPVGANFTVELLPLGLLPVGGQAPGIAADAP